VLGFTALDPGVTGRATCLVAEVVGKLVLSCSLLGLVGDLVEGRTHPSNLHTRLLPRAFAAQAASRVHVVSEEELAKPKLRTAIQLTRRRDDHGSSFPLRRNSNPGTIVR
jgi:hypothetical protein